MTTTPTTDAERSDTERLDWLESEGPHRLEHYYNGRWWVWRADPKLPESPTVRQAIDAAMSLNQEPRT